MPTSKSNLSPPEIHAAFGRYLDENGIRSTRTRREILDAVLQFRTHFEAEQLLCHLREHSHNVGKATVYRTLHLLVDCGIIKEVRFDVKQAYYERVWGEPPHDHIVCRKCHRIVEFDAAEVIALRDRIAARHGFSRPSHRLQVYAVCADCAAAGGVERASAPALDESRAPR